MTNGCRLTAIQLTLALACLLLPLFEVGANTVKGNVKDVNGNAPSGTDGYTITVVYNDGKTATINYPSAGISQTAAYTLSVGAATGTDKTVKMTFTRSANPADVRVVNGILSNDGQIQVIDINFAGAWGSTKASLPPHPIAPAPITVSCEPPPSCCGPSRGRFFRGRCR